MTLRGAGGLLAGLLLSLAGGAHSLACEWTLAGLVVDAAAALRRYDELAERFNDATAPAVTRVVFTDADVGARAWLKGLLRDAGLAVRDDPMGNIFGRWEGSDPALAPVVTGSHTDAIPLAGKFDGVLGVLGALEAVKALQAAGFRPTRSIEVVMFTSEEPTRFGLGCSGSRAMAGKLPAELLDGLCTKYPEEDCGTTFVQAAHAAGVGAAYATNAELVAATRVPRGAVHAFVELHIEQGPTLERAGVDIGVVTDIAAPATLLVEFHGNGGHAGGLLMPDRKDAGLAAAELSLAVERHVKGTGAIDAVGTAGKVVLEPGAVNSVPRVARMEIDVRDIDGARRDRTVQRIIASGEEIAHLRGVTFSHRILNADAPADCAPEVEGAVAWAAASLGLSSTRMVSRAYHDALFMASVAPTGMIFVPCRDGVSHRPDEWIGEKWLADGVKTLGLALARLAGGSGLGAGCEAGAGGGKQEL